MKTMKPCKKCGTAPIIELGDMLLNGQKATNHKIKCPNKSCDAHASQSSSLWGAQMGWNMNN